ncbi:MAG: hypothetical protein KAH23_04265, partial [Kiritimatiellae bacterium]|nr:hypothetical protein [Kiritimatiellia bacterium]
IVDEGLYGNLSAELIFTPFIKSKFYDNITFKTDYLDTRGIINSYGGDRYEYFQNVFGVDTDWLMAKNMNMGLSLLRKDLVPRDDDFYDQELVEYEEKFLYEYSIYSCLVIGAVATYSQTDFDDPDRQDRGIDDYSAFLTFGEEKGAEISLTSVSVLTLRAGYSQGYKWSFSQTNDTDTARITG